MCGFIVHVSSLLLDIKSDNHLQVSDAKTILVFQTKSFQQHDFCASPRYESTSSFLKNL
jgi:hypothetical protein